MDKRKVLVVYGSNNGSTAQLAEWVGEALSEAGLEVMVHPAYEPADPKEADAVVLGGALYAMRWPRSLRRYAIRHLADLRQKPVWCFSSGPLDTSANERDIPPTRSVGSIVGRVAAREHKTFGGSLSADAKGFMAKAMVRKGMVGDFRNREKIDEWARSIARVLAAPSASDRVA